MNFTFAKNVIVNTLQRIKLTFGSTADASQIDCCRQMQEKKVLFGSTQKSKKKRTFWTELRTVIKNVSTTAMQEMQKVDQYLGKQQA